MSELGKYQYRFLELKHDYAKAVLAAVALVRVKQMLKEPQEKREGEYYFAVYRKFVIPQV